MRYVWLFILTLVLSGCSSNPVMTDTQVIPETVDVSKESIDALRDNIPPIYLSKCLWMLQLENDSIEELNYVLKTNAERYRECYLIHNSLVDILAP